MVKKSTNAKSPASKGTPSWGDPTPEVIKPAETAAPAETKKLSPEEATPETIAAEAERPAETGAEDTAVAATEEQADAKQDEANATAQAFVNEDSGKEPVFGTQIPGVAQSGSNASKALISFVERIERVTEEISGLQQDRKEIFAELKAQGFEVSILREVLRRRKQDPESVKEHDALLELYEEAIR